MGQGMADDRGKATDERHGAMDYEEMLSFLGDEGLHEVTEELREEMSSRCEDVLGQPEWDAADSEAALARWRTKHPGSQKKAAKIHQTADYRQIVEEMLDAKRPEAYERHRDEIEAAKGDIAATRGLNALVALSEELGLGGFGWRSYPRVMDGIANRVVTEAFDEATVEQVVSKLEDYVAGILSTGDLEEHYWERHYDNYYRRWPRIDCFEIEDADDLDALVMLGAETGESPGSQLVSRILEEETSDDSWGTLVSDAIAEAFLSTRQGQEMQRLVGALFDEDDISCTDAYLDAASDYEGLVPSVVHKRFPEERIRTLIAANPRYSHIVEAERLRKEREAAMERDIVDRMPENPIDLFPVARSMTRRFVLHVGPTNSGKTHDAIDALGRAASGCYLAPLRLLAYEQYENLNEKGCACSLLTGEEDMPVDGARHVASTIEMADFSSPVDVAVIDEAQMLADPDRGSHWTDVILGIPASEIHVCLAPEAEDIVRRLVAECGDSCETVSHERMTPLEHEGGSFSFPSDVRKGDALIVFTRRAVQAVAAQVAAEGKSASMIYGALPYDVRHREAERFASGETEVVVATDAIGMGMNLPIRRIVFLEQAKFDGREKRFLSAGEVRQIAGRAGRYGIYDKGLWKSANATKRVRKLMSTDIVPLSSAPLGFVKSLLGVDGTVSDLLGRWAGMPVDAPFAKQGLEREIELAEALEEIVRDNMGADAMRDLSTKRLVYRFATLPFKEQLPGLLATWSEMFECELDGTKYEVRVPQGSLPRGMDDLEAQYAYTDLLHQYCRAFGRTECYEAIDARRAEISDRISEMIAGSAFEKRTCRNCGKPMPWNWPYPMCDPCHDRMYGRRRDDWW